MAVNVLDPYYLGITALVTLGYQLTFFFITWALKFDKVTDLAGGSNFVIVALLAYFLHQTYYVRQTVLTAAVTIWGLRLSGFLFYRIILWGEDKRFDGQRKNFGALVAFWIFQFLWVWIVTLPVTLVNSSFSNPPLGVNDYIGWSMWAIGTIYEAIADQQKLSFKQDENNKGKWCRVGVWKWTRHPNYFGELLLWWGVYISSLSVLTDYMNIAVISPLFVSFLLLTLSGIPLLEKSADTRYGKNPTYVAYKQETSPLLPFPPSWWSALPQFLKTLLFEWPMYNYLEDLAGADSPAPNPDNGNASSSTAA